MRKLVHITVLAAVVALAVPVAASAKRIPYEGKTSGGHEVSFELAKGKLWDFETGVPVSCLAIQGGGAPMTGAEPWLATWVTLGLKDYEFVEEVEPAFYYNDVERKSTVSVRRYRSGTVRGAIRVQYEFLIPKYPIGTFSIYSCLGEMSFSARPKR